MLKLWVGVSCVLAVAGQGHDYDYVFDYVDPPSLQPLPQSIRAAAAPPPPPPPQQRAPPAPPQRAPPPPPLPARSRRPPVQPLQLSQAPQQGRSAVLGGTTTTPIPILVDNRRIDTKTGAFVYEYRGGDGSAKYEYRHTNGTVYGNFTFINDLGEKETRYYSAGVHDPTLVDETTDPNYVDLGNYDLYKHLEQPYVHDDGSSLSGGRVVSRPPPQQAARPRQRAQQSRPPPLRKAAPPPPPPPPAASVFPGSSAPSHFSQPGFGAGAFDYDDLGAVAPAPPPPPPPAVRQPPRQAPRHRLDVRPATAQSNDAFLDSIIRQFQ